MTAKGLWKEFDFNESDITFTKTLITFDKTCAEVKEEQLLKV